MKKKYKGKLLAENNAILIFFSICFALSFFKFVNRLFFSFIEFFGCTESFKKIYVDFIVQCV